MTDRRLIAYRYLALLLALNYFAFRVEFFEQEYNDNHHPLFDRISLSKASLNWETFDKDNAPPAFVIDPEIQIEFLSPCLFPQREQFLQLQSFQLVRDKSPPHPFPFIVEL
ncbi:MAG: hypothetical protein HY033_07660 [Ignavibacteriae bacterium]|nr:hypothetical protein [Ignavibacteriota bacterium]